jgi:REP element-mobilizing transposase RayT
MPQSLAHVVLHIVYSTKHRTPWLADSSLRSELFAYSASILKNEVDSPALLIGGVEDHIHILCMLSRKVPIMDVVKSSKTETSKWLKRQHADLSGFQWQNGYGAFSVSASNIARAKRYIANQEAHHRRMTFKDEMRELYQRHGIEFDERYVWD